MMNQPPTTVEHCETCGKNTKHSVTYAYPPQADGTPRVKEKKCLEHDDA